MPARLAYGEVCEPAQPLCPVCQRGVGLVRKLDACRNRIVAVRDSKGAVPPLLLVLQRHLTVNAHARVECVAHIPVMIEDILVEP